MGACEARGNTSITLCRFHVCICLHIYRLRQVPKICSGVVVLRIFSHCVFQFCSDLQFCGRGHLVMIGLMILSARGGSRSSRNVSDFQDATTVVDMLVIQSPYVSGLHLVFLGDGFALRSGVFVLFPETFCASSSSKMARSRGT